MDYSSFRLKYLGRICDYDNRNGFQCVDLVKFWAKEGWGLEPGAVGYQYGYAKFVFKYSNSMLKEDQVIRVKNTGKLAPPQGSINVFDSAKKNPAGHIAIVDSSSLLDVIVLEQNGGSGNGDGKGTNAVRLKKYVYGNNGSGIGRALGWLIPQNGSAHGTSPKREKYSDRRYV